MTLYLTFCVAYFNCVLISQNQPTVSIKLVSIQPFKSVLSEIRLTIYTERPRMFSSLVYNYGPIYTEPDSGLFSLGKYYFGKKVSLFI